MPINPPTYPGRMISGWGSTPGGVNSGISPELILPTQNAFAINWAHRTGWGHPRPSFRKIDLNFQDMDEAQTAFEDGLFQEVGGYKADSGAGSLISMQGGRVFQVEISESGAFKVSERTIASDRNPNNRSMAWSIQVQNYFIIQDGQSKPFIFDGAASFRADQDRRQVPVGERMAYYGGRLFVSKGREYVAGNIVFDPTTGTPSLNNRDSVLYFTDNDYINEGGAFAVPIESGNITGFKVIASPNTALGEGELIVFTLGNAFATSLPTDRTQWKNLTYPVQRMIQLTTGAYGQDSIVNVNEDLFFRSKYGVSTVQFVVRNQGQWGSRPLSTEMNRMFNADAESFLPYCRGTQFHNRLLMLTSPGTVQNHGVFWRGIAPLDFYPISSMGETSPPAWDGVWTGLRFLKLVTLTHMGIERCFAYVLNQFDKIELWEICKDGEYKSDWDGSLSRPIEWATESRTLFTESEFALKELMSSNFFFDNLNGECNLAWHYRPDGYPCWFPWHTTTVCAKTELCPEDFTGTCPTIPNLQPQYVPRIQLPQPPDLFFEVGTNSSQLTRTFWVMQVRTSGVGYIQAQHMQVCANIKADLPEGSQL